MKSEVIVKRREDFGHDWILVLETKKVRKSFYLGQDVKFCNRVLGMSPRDVVNEIGSGDFTKDSNLKILGKFISKRLELSSKSIDELGVWDLCCQ
tara:strand:+ start:1776 stop:2060 length:285 start_codon:yes stop_codon:yes gene_type:complete